MKKVKEFARQALTADENSAEAHASMASALFFGDWNAVEAEKEVLRAIELNPSYSTAHLVYSVMLAASGRLDEAIDQDRRAMDLDPFSVIINWNASGTLFLARRYDEALAQASRTLEVDPGAKRYWVGGALRIYEQTGKYEAALDLLDQHLPESEGGKARAARMRQAYEARGPAGYWQSSLDFALSKAKVEKPDPVQLAFLYTQVGDRSRALDCLEQAYRERNGDMPFLNCNRLRPLRKTAVQALVDRIRPRLLPKASGPA
jgi:tetratricopeptide (TPR) repeat protein